MRRPFPLHRRDVGTGLCLAVTALLLASCAGRPLRAGRPEAAIAAAYPDPARLEAEVLAFEAADREAPPPPGALLCLGSSSLRFWQPTLARDLAPHAVIARGFGGSTMLDALHFAPRIVLPYRPAAILLYEGDNDLDAGVAPADFIAVFQRFVALVLAELPDAQLYVLSIKPSAARWAKWPAMGEANVLLRNACAQDPRLHYVDVATAMLGADGAPRPELYLADRLHLSAAGYALWTDVVRGALAATPP